MSKILIVDDDADFLETVSVLLERAGHQVMTACDGLNLLKTQADESSDLVILDVLLEHENGFELAMELRKVSDVPIIILSGKDHEVDKVIGLELGADDYITKPYCSNEFLARVGSVLRRSRLGRAPETEVRQELAHFDNWHLDTLHRRLLTQTGDEVTLTSGEYSLLEAFVRRPGQILSREELLEFTSRRNTFDRSIDVQILRLRRKIEPDEPEPYLIKAIRSIGYVFAAKVEWD